MPKTKLSAEQLGMKFAKFSEPLNFPRLAGVYCISFLSTWAKFSAGDTTLGGLGQSG